MLPSLTLPRRLVSEALGSALLLAAVVGSGIMGERLAEGNGALALLANTLATGSALVVLILVFGPLSGAHFNPLVTLAAAADRSLAPKDVLPYVLAQSGGALAGVALANLMFHLPPFTASQHARTGASQWLSEALATFGLLLVVRSRASHKPFAVAAYIMAAYWFTASTSFANPSVTLARSLTDTFAGIRPSDISAFIAAQVVGAAAALILTRWLFPRELP